MYCTVCIRLLRRRSMASQVVPRLLPRGHKLLVRQQIIMYRPIPVRWILRKAISNPFHWLRPSWLSLSILSQGGYFCVIYRACRYPDQTEPKIKAPSFRAAWETQWWTVSILMTNNARQFAIRNGKELGVPTGTMSLSLEIGSTKILLQLSGGKISCSLRPEWQCGEFFCLE